jgi:hypothetical protein
MLNEKDLWISLQDFILAIDGLLRSEWHGRLTPIEGAEDNGASLSYHKVGRVRADLYAGNLSQRIRGQQCCLNQRLSAFGRHE